ncbi:MAG: HEPN domain-containing protein [Proteobacteria bacterium]|nr:HEPN domain-containing protein [Pseudomonadota bacterium]
MKIVNVELAIKLCKEHLDNTGSKGTEIESILTKYLLVYICGAYETEIKKMVTQRAAKAGDKELVSFVRSTIKTFRSLKMDDIRGNLLGRFCDSYKAIFDSKIIGTEAEARFTNIVLNRHLVAHGREINITFDELVESYYKASTVLNTIKEALGVNGSIP